ncbi:hypothetical protein SDC9_188383 [bioreactor metagenome]|uniref:SLH domain-containing protein n=1 Tax=bioreactor metagenome TaxID=1076179 RepID=A0A645HZY5_9ZZZZ
MLNLPVYDTAASFDDTSGHWASAYIETARQYNIISGTGDNRFEPDIPITREQMAVMLDNLQVEFPEGTGATSYTDVNAMSSPWSYDAIMRMSSAGIIQGFPDGSFGLGKILTRAQMAVMMERISAYVPDNLY